MQVRAGGDGDADAALRVALALPEWFNAGGRRELAIDLPVQHLLVAGAAGRVDGFLAWYVHEAIGWIAWMGVLPERHRSGVGRALVAEFLARMRDAGVGEVRVKTLGDGVDYEPYERTRAFYRALGFTDFSRVQQPDDPGCPESLTLRLCPSA